MRVFQIGQQVIPDLRTIPRDAHHQKTFRIIGMRKSTFAEKDYLIQMPTGTGWHLASQIGTNDREQFYISSADYQPGIWAYWVYESALQPVSNITKADGAQCTKCKDFVYMANQTNDFVCRPCTLDPYRCSPPAWSGDD